ncbi:MAG: histidine kinase N-terminal domain-containing protein [Desulfuromusa sp.]|nr:histidine kinase N-terminal domain-containing protein [Desulfuromusa sp.]
MLNSLCQQHSDLGEADIQQIQKFASCLGSIAELTDSDVFIDCRTKDPDQAIVVAQDRSSSGKSLYFGSVVGKFAHRSKEPAVIRTLEIGMPTMDMHGVTQEDKNVRQSVSPIKNSAGDVIAVLIAEKDVTKSVKAEEKLSILTQTTEQLITRGTRPQSGDNSLPYYVTDGILMFNRSGICAYANPVAEKIYKNLGYLEPLEGLSFSNMTFHGMEFAEILDKKQIILNDLEVGRYVFHVKYTYVKNKNEDFTGVVMLINDVTDMKKQERELVLKTVAISEIHHRVKNNLQTIASLLKLQARRIDDPLAKNAFNESINQVLSIAATHEILAEEGRDDVDIMVMLKKIKSNTLRSGLLDHKAITINLKGDTFLCESDMATSIALVVNEVTQNCLKYAFPARDSGTIEIEIYNGTAYSNISIIDDGVGYDVKEKSAEKLGLMIVRRIITEKLRGNLTMESGPGGTKVLFDFPLSSQPGESM